MVPPNNKGQILVEISLVMFLIGLAILFGALNGLSNGRQTYQKYQLTKKDTHGKKIFLPLKK